MDPPMSLNSTNKNNDNDDTNYSNSVINMNDDNNNDDAEDMLSVPSTPDHLKHQFLPTPISSFTPHQFNDLALPSPFPDFGIYSPTQGYSNVSMSRDWNASKLITDPLIQSPPLSSSSYFLQTASPTAPSDFPHFPTRFPNNRKSSNTNKLEQSPGFFIGQDGFFSGDENEDDSQTDYENVDGSGQLDTSLASAKLRTSATKAARVSNLNESYNSSYSESNGQKLASQSSQPFSKAETKKRSNKRNDKAQSTQQGQISSESFPSLYISETAKTTFSNDTSSSVEPHATELMQTSSFTTDLKRKKKHSKFRINDDDSCNREGERDGEYDPNRVSGTKTTSDTSRSFDSSGSPTEAAANILMLLPSSPVNGRLDTLSKSLSRNNLVANANLSSNKIKSLLNSQSSESDTSYADNSTITSALLHPNSGPSYHVIPSNTSPTVPVLITCKCQKTRCLKLYCDCFKIDQLCDGCSCNDCANKDKNDPVRKEAMEMTLEKNPVAFKPRVSEDPLSNAKGHLAGCKCKKSNCLKKYCECFNGTAPCGPKCRCLECRNTADLYDGDSRISNHPTGSSSTHKGDLTGRSSMSGISASSAVSGTSVTSASSSSSMPITSSSFINNLSLKSQLPSTMQPKESTSLVVGGTTVTSSAKSASLFPSSVITAGVNQTIIPKISIQQQVPRPTFISKSFQQSNQIKQAQNQLEKLQTLKSQTPANLSSISLAKNLLTDSDSSKENSDYMDIELSLSQNSTNSKLDKEFDNNQNGPEENPGIAESKEHSSADSDIIRPSSDVSGTNGAFSGLRPPIHSQHSPIRPSHSISPIRENSSNRHGCRRGSEYQLFNSHESDNPRLFNSASSLQSSQDNESAENVNASFQSSSNGSVNEGLASSPNTSMGHYNLSDCIQIQSLLLSPEPAHKTAELSVVPDSTSRASMESKTSVHSTQSAKSVFSSAIKPAASILRPSPSSSAIKASSSNSVAKNKSRRHALNSLDKNVSMEMENEVDTLTSNLNPDSSVEFKANSTGNITESTDTKSNSSLAQKISERKRRTEYSSMSDGRSPNGAGGSSSSSAIPTMAKLYQFAGLCEDRGAEETLLALSPQRTRSSTGSRHKSFSTASKFAAAKSTASSSTRQSLVGNQSENNHEKKD